MIAYGIENPKSTAQRMTNRPLPAHPGGGETAGPA